MDLFEKEYQKNLELLRFKNYEALIKRIIDFALDTEDVFYYKLVADFLNWYDKNNKSEEMHTKIESILNQLYEKLKTKERISSSTVINLTEIEKKYPHGFELGPINLEIKTGQIIGLVGENGNGKTTLLRTLCHEIKADLGDIKYEFEFKDLFDLRTKLVYIPQRTKTWYGSMYQNLEFTASCYGYTPDENNLVIDLVITRLGLRAYKNHSWKSLSSGYKMRFELARMLLRKPKILLIDEPLANLDIIAQQTILEDFRQIANSPFRPIAIVLSSQQLYEVEKVSDEVVFLKKGKQQNLNIENEKIDFFTIELETTESISYMQEKLQKYDLKQIKQNGATMVVSFDRSMTFHSFLNILVKESIQVTYLRNITQSSRRFFVN